jgi:small subunit ribosomal protein S22
LRQAELKAEQTAKTLLQMPPVMNERETDTTILDSDVALSGYDSAKLVFTDITYGIHDRERIIVVRDADGDLGHANGDERARLNQIYFPHKGRKHGI